MKMLNHGSCCISILLTSGVSYTADSTDANLGKADALKRHFAKCFSSQLPPITPDGAQIYGAKKRTIMFNYDSINVCCSWLVDGILYLRTCLCEYFHRCIIVYSPLFGTGYSSNETGRITVRYR